MYINDNGDLVLQYNNDSLLTTYKEFATYWEQSNIEPEDDGQLLFEKVKYSIAFLYEIKNTLVENAVSLSINEIGVYEKSNSVKIGIPDPSYEFPVVDFLVNHLEGFNLDQIYFTYDGTTVVNTSYSAYGGTAMMYRTGFIFYYYHEWGTIGYNAYDPSTGYYGVVTNAHVAYDYETWYNEDHKKIGSYSLIQCGDEVDAAFIPFSTSVSWIPTYNVKYVIGSTTYYNYLSEVAPSSGVLIEGAPTFKVGISTHYTEGVILNTDTYIQVYNYDPALVGNSSGMLTYYHAVKYSNASENGDSGGPVWVSFGGRGATHYLIAIHFAGTSDDYGVGIKESYIEDALGVIPVLDPY